MYPFHAIPLPLALQVSEPPAVPTHATRDLVLLVHANKARGVPQRVVRRVPRQLEDVRK